MATPVKRLFSEFEETTVDKSDHGNIENNDGNTGPVDVDYFKSYSDVYIHQEMLSDEIRTNTYRWAILKNYEMFYKKVVLDVGAGTGILSMFAVQAGAKKVYAVEASQLANQLAAIVKENKMDDKIAVVHGKVEEVDIPEEVDVIISEWMGYCLLYESMLNSVIYARDKWLKPSGVIFPSIASLYIVPISDEDYLDRMTFWSEDVRHLYKVSMETMIPLARKNLSHNATVKCISPESPLSHAQIACQLSLKTIQISDLEKIEKSFTFHCFGHAEFHGFGLWFEVDFPNKIKLTTSPYNDPTHWQQCVFYVEKPVRVKQDTEISGQMKLSPNTKNPRFLDINLDYTIKGHTWSKCYYMNDIVT